MRVPKWLMALGCAVPLMALADDTVQMTPGRWQETPTAASVTVNGKRVASGDLTTEAKFSCIAPNEARNPSLYFMEHSPGDNCAVPEGTVGGGRIAMRSQCRLKNTTTPAAVSVAGRYDAQSYHTDIKAVGSFAESSLPFEITFAIDGKYVGPCKGDEE